MAEKKPKKATRAELAARYGYALKFFESNAELKRLLTEAQKKNWDAANFQAAIRNTTWWKQRSEAQRQYDTSASTDPAQHARNVAQTRAALALQARAMGFEPTAAWLDRVSKQVTRNGSTEEEIQSLVAAEWYTRYDKKPNADITEGTQTGQVATVVNQLKAMAAQYGYPLGDDTLENQTFKVLNGTATAQSFEDTYKTWAKTHFQGAAHLIDAGQSVAEILDPYAQIAAQELGSDKSAILASDPMYQAALNGADGGGMMSLPAWRTKIRTDSQYGWDKSANAQQQAYQMVAGLQSMFQGG